MKTERRINEQRKEVRRIKLTVNHDGVWLDEQKIQNCTQIDIKNINPTDTIQVALYLAVDEVDVQYHSEEIRFH